MTRSRRHTPIFGMTTAETDKPFKVQEHKRERRAMRQGLRCRQRSSATHGLHQKMGASGGLALARRICGSERATTMVKSIHFNQVPTMNGKRTLRFTDMVAENYKQRELAKVHAREMASHEPDYDGLKEDPDLVIDDDNLASWDCHWCEYREATGIFRQHHHEYD